MIFLQPSLLASKMKAVAFGVVWLLLIHLLDVMLLIKLFLFCWFHIYILRLIIVCFMVIPEYLLFMGVEH